jgi:nitroreductase
VLIGAEFALALRWKNLMSETLKLIQERHSARTAFDPQRPVRKEDLLQILEAGRWAPTAHNMQNFEIVAVDDPELLTTIGKIKRQISKTFIRENYQQLSFSPKDLVAKKTGILAAMFPRSWWTTPGANLDHVAIPLSRTIQGSPALLIVLYDTKKRAPASKGDVLGMISLGCMMENMWIMAQSLSIGFHVMSVFSATSVEPKLKSLLNIPKRLKIAFACRLGYPVPARGRYIRVRRDVEDFTHYNRFANKGLPWLD